MEDLNDIPDDFPMPPPNFAFLVESIMMQTQMQLGIFPAGIEEEEVDVEPNLEIARHSIDLLGMLQEKTRGNLTMEEQRMLENGLTELRFRFVQVSEDLQKQSTPAAQPEKPLIITADGGKGSKTE